MNPRAQVGLACRQAILDGWATPEHVARLNEVADFTTRAFDGPLTFAPVDVDRRAEAKLARFAEGLDVLLVCHGAPRVTAAVLAAAPTVRMVGELEGDRFAGRVDLDAATRSGVIVVDTNHGSSQPVAEWALALCVLGLRHAGRWTRALFADEPAVRDRTRTHRELTGKRVGLVGLGHIAYRLIELLAPFHVDLVAHDPFAPRELADALDVTFAPLDVVLASSDVVVVLTPLTDATRGMLGDRELALLRPGSVFVNVSRGAVVQTDALVRRLREDDVTACLDVLDPEPIPVGHPLRHLSNVVLSPHVASGTEEDRVHLFSLMVDEVLRFLRGEEPRAQLTARVRQGRAPQSAIIPTGTAP